MPGISDTMKRQRSKNRFAYKIRHFRRKFILMIALKGDHSYQPLSGTAWAKKLPIRFDFDLEAEAQAALKIAKEILESGKPYFSIPFTGDQIRACADAIRQKLPVREIWFFGYSVRGEACKDSDIDFLVVLPDGHGIERPCFEAKLAIAKAHSGVPCDVLVIPEGEVNNPTSSLIKTALKEGVRIA